VAEQQSPTGDIIDPSLLVLSERHKIVCRKSRMGSKPNMPSTSRVDGNAETPLRSPPFITSSSGSGIGTRRNFWTRSCWQFVVVLTLLAMHSSVDAYAVDAISLVDGDMMMIKTIPASWVMEDYDGDEEEEDADEEEWQSIRASALLPRVDVHDVARALEYTSNLNRMMQTTAAARMNGNKAATRCSSAMAESSSTRSAAAVTGTRNKRAATRQQQFRGGSTTSLCVASRTTNTMRLPMTAPGEIDRLEAPPTIFHAPRVPTKTATGTAGSATGTKLTSLSDFLNRALQCIIIPPKDSRTDVVSKDALLSLAMLYLDRACAVDTPRYQFQNERQHHLQSPSCPFCSPATVHRLALTALLVAASANNLSICYHDVSAAFGISRHECETMMAWMRTALGDAGIFVTPEEMRAFASVWHKRFPASATVTTSTATV
jgi:hypothetical protein